MSDTTFGTVSGNANITEAGRDVVQAQGDAVRGDKHETHIHYHQPKPAAPRPVPDAAYLAYLLDRLRQERALVTAVQQHQQFDQPLLCLLHGQEENCCSDAFAKRIAQRILPQIPAVQAQLQGEGCEAVQVRSEDFRNREEWFDMLRLSLAQHFTGNKTATLNDVAQAMSARRRPVLLFQTLRSSECYAGADTLRDFQTFWHEEFALPNGHRHLLLVCLFFYQDAPRKKSLFDLFKKETDFLHAAAPSLQHCTVLEKLEHIKTDHLRKWLDSDEVQAFFGRSIASEVRNWLAQPDNTLHDDGLPLEILADKLIPFLNRLARQEDAP